MATRSNSSCILQLSLLMETANDRDGPVRRVPPLLPEPAWFPGRCEQ
jgi:hypothetical protein